MAHSKRMLIGNKYKIVSRQGNEKGKPAPKSAICREVGFVSFTKREAVDISWPQIVRVRGRCIELK